MSATETPRRLFFVQRQREPERRAASTSLNHPVYGVRGNAKLRFFRGPGIEQFRPCRAQDDQNRRARRHQRAAVARSPSRVCAICSRRTTSSIAWRRCWMKAGSQNTWRNCVSSARGWIVHSPRLTEVVWSRILHWWTDDLHNTLRNCRKIKFAIVTFYETLGA